ncbi:M48 family metalloprotease [Clostridium estertheticum]|uniref:Uncharacterized protein n=1 Tax=Clostridium estertheticum subsp. estertheticum TaxID=1552 RepID=A0A1J0GHM7_9CLOT|nr:hypothetical protein [Clostridium estertheticum]APC40829.1 hypothetical protein A7L45_12475 [Clostridium estertheticum subsp. estertheticum]MBZ9617321.1 hypothetical protein [Clostridium estertheticum subsp. laramiense]WAG73008.1 hypothetical protein LL032_17920 [Clostridium estertheticum]
MSLHSVEFSTENVKKRISTIYNQSNGRIKEFMDINNYQFIFSLESPWAISDDRYPDPNGLLGKTSLLKESGQIIVNIYYEKLTQTLKFIFHNFYNFKRANRVCDLYIEFILAHELAHVGQFTQNKYKCLVAKEDESGVLEANRSYEIEADNIALDYMEDTYSEIGRYIGIIGRKIHVNSLNNATMIRELIEKVD